MKLLNMSNISKSFYGVNVLNNIDFSVDKGEVHALLGENGAGKSTLMNILAGVYQRDNGTIEFDGEIIEHVTVSTTEAKGIAFVHQELNLFNDLKVYENLFLKKEITKFGIIQAKEMILETKKLFESLGVDIDPTEIVENLETSKKQLLEIAKALFGNAKLIILDEPTTSLNNSEIEHLFSIINKLKSNGVSFIFISHKMTEIFTLADRYTVLRNGKMVNYGLIKDTNPTKITKDMVGESFSEKSNYKPRELGDIIFKTTNLTGNHFKNINLELRKGEILGVTGLMGAGVSNFLNALFGAEPIISGKLEINNVECKNNSVKNSMKNSVAMVAANRKENSIIPDFSLLDNMCIAEFCLSSKKQLINSKKEISTYDSYAKILNIKANSHNDLITSLSGGNQQKVILGRWLNTDADIILLDNPTQGIDVGAKAEIYKLILEIAKEGKTIIVNTLEIPEIMQIADKCAVFYQGEVKVLLDKNEINEHNVMLYATNAIALEQGEK